MTSETDAVAKLARESAKAHTIKTADGREFLILPAGATQSEISDEHSLKVTAPRYIRQAVTVQTADSLVDYIAQIDYHAPDQAAMTAHRATLVLPFSEEWTVWNSISGKLKPQLEFARFIEENGADVRAPDAAELLEAVRDLQAHRKVSFIKAVRTASDNESFDYKDESGAVTKAGIELPTKFKLGIPVYFGEPETEVFAFLRWAIDADKGGLSLGIALHRAEHVRQAVFKQIVGAVAERTNRPAVFGRM